MAAFDQPGIINQHSKKELEIPPAIRQANYRTTLNSLAASGVQRAGTVNLALPVTLVSET